jgi:hypothetical protein
VSEPIQKDAHIWARHPEDYYIEPEWCSRRLFEVEHFEGGIYDPACGCGRIVRSAAEAGYLAKGNDIVARAGGADPRYLADFRGNNCRSDNIVSNPPFGIADDFARQALRLAIGKVALLLPTKWMNAAGRGAWLEKTPLARVHLLSPRPSMPPGPVIEAGIKPGNGTTDFAWFVWQRGYLGRPEIRFLRRDRDDP